MVAGPREFLACLCERGAARAVLGVDVACRVRILCERARHARTAFAGLLHPRRLRDVLLLTARRRQRRVVRRLRRLAALGLKFGDAGQQRLVLRDHLLGERRELADPLNQSQHQRLHVIGKRINLLGSHASLNQPAAKISTRHPQFISSHRVSSYACTVCARRPS